MDCDCGVSVLSSCNMKEDINKNRCNWQILNNKSSQKGKKKKKKKAHQAILFVTDVGHSPLQSNIHPLS